MKKITVRIPKKKLKRAKKILKNNNIKNFIELSYKNRVKLEIITSEAMAEKVAALMKEGLGIGKSLDEGLIEISDTTVYSPYIQEKEADHLMEKEIETKIKGFAKLDTHYITFIILSSIIATIGVMLGSDLILIGAMLVSPLMLPMMSTSFSVVVKKPSVFRHAINTELVGVLITIVVIFLTTLLIPHSIDRPDLVLRAGYSWTYIPLAIVLGVVAAYSFATNKARSLTGVAIAVSLLPPLVISVILSMMGQIVAAVQAMLIFCINVIGIHLSSMAVFVYLHIKEPEWYTFKIK